MQNINQLPEKFEQDIQNDLRNRSTELWVLSQDTDWIEEPKLYEEPNAYHEPPLARKERQKQQADVQFKIRVAAMEKEKEKELEKLAAWVKAAPWVKHNHKAAPDQQGEQVLAKRKLYKKVVGSKNPKGLKRMEQKKKETQESQRRLAERVQQGLVKAVDNAQVHVIPMSLTPRRPCADHDEADPPQARSAEVIPPATEEEMGGDHPVAHHSIGGFSFCGRKRRQQLVDGVGSY
ncbi:hypothetical protein N0V85_002061 [Neurospora sp. IMI 360204]|nr:hypothetical protein N0V85_002061 [Neurospora sp. IMI 360204]